MDNNYIFKKITVFFLALSSLLIFEKTAKAQTPQYSYQGGTGSNTIPFNSTASNKLNNVYTPTQLGAASVTGVVSKIYIRSNTATTSTYTNLRLRLAHSNTVSSYTTGDPFIGTNGMEVFFSPSINITTTVNGWVEFVTNGSFIYNGTQNLILEASQEGYTGTGFSVKNNTSLGNTRLFGLFSATTGTAGTGLADFGFDLTPATPCTNPATAGTASTTSANVCAGTNFTLSLTGNSQGTGQTYQWQSSPNNAAPWTNIGTAASISSLTTSQTSTSHYRCGVTCNSGTTVFSTSVLVTSPALVSGTSFTINNTQPASSTNFQTFTSAISSISCGINGPVTFTVAPGSGPYNEQVTIPQIFGASNTNKITINGNGATLAFNSSNTATRSGIHLNGADYFVIDNLIIDGQAGTFAWGVTLTNQADSNVVNNCTINIGNITSNSTNFIGIVLNGSATGTGISGNNGNGNQFLNNTINGGYYNYYMYGSSASTTQNINNVIRGGVIKDAYNYGVYGIYMSAGLVLDSLDISRPTRTVSTTTGGVFLTTGCVGALVQRNRIHNLFDAFTTSTSISYGIYIGADATTVSPNKVINNLIYNIGGNGTSYSIYNTGGDNMQAYHNTISLDDGVATTGAAYGLYQTTLATGLDYRNNVVNITRSGTGIKRAIHFNTTTSTITSNNNLLFMNAGAGTDNNLGQYGTTNYATLTNWQTANSNAFDQQSVSTDPIFVDPNTGNYKPTAPSINDIGAALGVTTDIVGVTRSATNPDPGAYEFALGACANPVTAGTATTSTANVCANTSFTLSLTGNSVGAGQTYQWQSSPNNTAPWTNVGTAATSAVFATSQASTSHYRCAVTCNAGTTVFSTSILVTSPALVSGTNFTINNTQPASSTNFQTFAAAISSISCGINGPVTFTVGAGSGPYNEQVTIPEIAGASNTNKITINGNGATLAFNSTNSATRSGIHLNGADYMVINNLIIDGQAGTFAWGVTLSNQADSNIVSNCTINIGNLTATSTNFIGIVLNGSETGTGISGNNGNGNQFTNNTINGGFYNYYFYGSTTSTVQNINNVVRGGVVLDAHSYAVYGAYMSPGFTIDSLDISRPNRTVSTTAGGVFLTTGCLGTLVQRNKIHNLFDQVTTPTSITYGIYVGADATTTNPNRVINNLIYNIGGNGTSYGIYNTGGDSMQVYHNTISLDDAVATTGTAYGLYQTTLATGIDYKNNLVSITRSGTGIKRAIHFATTTSTITSNNNVLYINAASGTDNNLGQYGTTNYATLTDWQTANTNAFDQQSVSANPTFQSPTNYTPTVSAVNNVGVNVGVTTDIINAARNATTPDAGAYEFTTLTAGLNFGADALVSPLNSLTGCYTNAETVTVRIRNSSTATHNFATNPVTVTVNVTGAVTQTFTTTINTGTLVSDATQDVVLSTTFNMSTAGTYTFNANTTLTGDVNATNDAIQPVNRNKVAVSTGTISASPATYCGNGGTLPTLNTSGHTGYNNLQWQVSSVSGSGYVDISSATTVPYTVTAAITENKYYRLVATCGTTTANSTEATVVYTNPTITSTTPRTRCGTGTVNISATASAGATVNWYAASTGGTALASGNTFTTPSISSSTTYYAAASAGQSISSLGLQNRVGATGNTGYTDVGLMFDATAPFVLQSVAIYPVGTGGSATITIDLKNASGTTIQTYTGTVTTSALPGIKTIVPVNFNVPSGTGQRLVMNGATGLTSLIRESSTGYTYPYTLTGVASITSAYTGGASASYYYYFYDWQVVTGCQSARTPVVATVDNGPGCVPTPVSLLSFKGEKLGTTNKLEWITANEQNNAGFELQRSTDGSNFSMLYYINSKGINGNSSTNLEYHFIDAKPLAGNGYYRLKQIDKDGKTSFSSIVLLKGNKVSTLTISNIYPNPATEKLNIVLSTPISDKVSIVITDVRGKVVAQQNVVVATGDNSFYFNVSHLSKGSYFIKAICSKGCEGALHKFVK